MMNLLKLLNEYTRLSWTVSNSLRLFNENYQFQHSLHHRNQPQWVITNEEMHTNNLDTNNTHNRVIPSKYSWPAVENLFFRQYPVKTAVRMGSACMAFTSCKGKTFQLEYQLPHTIQCSRMVIAINFSLSYSSFSIHKSHWAVANSHSPKRWGS